MSNPEDKKGFPVWVIVFISFFFLILMILFFAMGVHFFFKSKTVTTATQGFTERIVQKIVDTVVEKVTGGKGEVKIHLGEKQEFVFKDKKNGQTFAFKTTSSLPSDFPKDIPIFTPSHFTRNAEALGFNTYSWETNKPVKEVALFYQTQLKASGWKESGSIPSSEEGAILNFKKGKETLMIQIASDNRQTNFNLVVGSY